MIGVTVPADRESSRDLGRRLVMAASVLALALALDGPLEDFPTLRPGHAPPGGIAAPAPRPSPNRRGASAATPAVVVGGVSTERSRTSVTGTQGTTPLGGVNESAPAA